MVSYGDYRFLTCRENYVVTKLYNKFKFYKKSHLYPYVLRAVRNFRLFISRTCFSENDVISDLLVATLQLAVSGGVRREIFQG